LIILFWDIDGTLLTTARAGIYAWEDALAEVAGQRTDLSGFDTAGVPDHQIARRLLREIAQAPDDPAPVALLVRRYEDLLPAALGRRQGRVLPNVREILQQIDSRPDLRSRLLTGNTRRGAEAKLRHYGLDRFFREGGAFSDRLCQRDDIARAAVEAVRVDGWTPAAGAVVIGDTPHDIRCGRAAEARTIAVATGGYDMAALERHDPWLVLPELPPPDEFLRLVTGAEVPGRG
jgi:phosphoglycolate phosphatase